MAVGAVQDADRGDVVGAGHGRGRVRQTQQGTHGPFPAGQRVLGALQEALRYSAEPCRHELRVDLLAFRVVTGQAYADERDAVVTQLDQVLEAHGHAAPVVDVHGMEGTGAPAGSLPQRHDRLADRPERFGEARSLAISPSRRTASQCHGPSTAGNDGASSW